MSQPSLSSDHVLADLSERYLDVLDVVEATSAALTIRMRRVVESLG